jgi:hypothetical protein
VTTISFRRALQTGDDKDLPVENAAVFLEWGYDDRDGAPPQRYNIHE